MARRVAGHCKRRTVRVRKATRGGDVVRPGILEEVSVGWRGIAEREVWWRWWEEVNGVVIARGFALRITTVLDDKRVWQQQLQQQQHQRQPSTRPCECS
jgi:hypothetical protein